MKWEIKSGFQIKEVKMDFIGVEVFGIYPSSLILIIYLKQYEGKVTSFQMIKDKLLFKMAWNH